MVGGVGLGLPGQNWPRRWQRWSLTQAGAGHGGLTGCHQLKILEFKVKGAQFLPLPEPATSDGGWKVTVEAWGRLWDQAPYPLTAVWGLHLL